MGDLINSLTQSPFFKQMHIIGVEKFASGLSHAVYKVLCTHESQAKPLTTTYVAKYIKGKSTGRKEHAGLAFAHTAGVSVEPLYCDDEWLVTEYFDGVNLDTVTLSIESKLALLFPVIAKYHVKSLKLDNSELPLLTLSDDDVVIQRLDIHAVITSLLSRSHLKSSIKKQLTALLAKHLPMAQSQNLAVIHGDLNLSNVLIDVTTQTIKLIDFESVSVAPVEYELGMMLAVNEIFPEVFFSSLNDYDNVVDIDVEMVTRYAILSNVINALWYFEQYGLNEDISYKQRADKQLKFLKLLTS